MVLLSHVVIMSIMIIEIYALVSLFVTFDALSQSYIDIDTVFKSLQLR